MKSFFLLLAFGATVVAGDIFKCDNGTVEVICAAHECCGVDGNCGDCPTSQMACKWGRGDGTGGREEPVGKVGPDDAEWECEQLVRSLEPTANGATVQTRGEAGTGNQRACYAEFDMNGVDDNTVPPWGYTTCRLDFNLTRRTITSTEWGSDTMKNPIHRASPYYDVFTNQGMPNLSKYDNISTWKTDLTKWKDWTEAAKSNKKLHWNIIMGSMYTKHIEKEQKTLERLSNDVKSQLNSMYLGEDAGCKGRARSNDGRCKDKTDPETCNEYDRDRDGVGECVWNGAEHKTSPIQVSMRDTKLAYEALVDCLKASVKGNEYPTYLDLVQKRGTSAYTGNVQHDEASFDEDADLSNGGDNETTDYLLLLKTKQAHYNLQSSYECSNEEMNFEVRLYKMSKLESRYKLLYLYCKCDLTSQIKKFKKMVNTICGGKDTGFATGHCYSKAGTTVASNTKIGYPSTTDHTDFVTTIQDSECDIDEAFCPEHVFYYTDGGMNAHPAGECSKCVDLGGDHSNTTVRGVTTTPAPNPE